MKQVILAINSGSSSIKFALYHFQTGKPDPGIVASGQFSGIGDAPQLTLLDSAGKVTLTKTFPATSLHEQLLEDLLAWIEHRSAEYTLTAAGHRIVHGGAVFTTPVLLDENVLGRLEAQRARNVRRQNLVNRPTPCCRTFGRRCSG